MKQKIKDFWRKEGLFTITMIGIVVLVSLLYWYHQKFGLELDIVTRVLLGFVLVVSLILFFSALFYFATHKEKMTELKQLDWSKPFEALVSFFGLFFPEEKLEKQIEKREQEKKLKEVEKEIAYLEKPASKAESEREKLADKLKIAEQWQEHKTEERVVEIKGGFERRRTIEQEIQLEKQKETNRILNGRRLQDLSKDELEQLQRITEDLEDYKQHLLNQEE